MEANVEPTGQAANVSRRGCAPAASTAASSAFGQTLRRAKRTARRMRARRAQAGSAAALDSPPPEVERELADAARACETLAAQGKELRFDRRADGRVSVALIDVSSRALDVIEPTGLFLLLSQSH